MENTMYIPKSSINFDALVAAYCSDEGIRHELHAIFARVASFLYWKKIQTIQRKGVSVADADFVMANRDNFCEKPDFVQSRIRLALSTVIRQSCYVNSMVARRGGERFLVRRFYKSEDGMFDIFEAESLAMDIAEAFYRYMDVDIMNVNWLMKA